MDALRPRASSPGDQRSAGTFAGAGRSLPSEAHWCLWMTHARLQFHRRWGRRCGRAARSRRTRARRRRLEPDRGPAREHLPSTDRNGVEFVVHLLIDHAPGKPALYRGSARLPRAALPSDETSWGAPRTAAPPCDAPVRSRIQGCPARFILLARSLTPTGCVAGAQLVLSGMVAHGPARRAVATRSCSRVTVRR